MSVIYYELSESARRSNESDSEQKTTLLSLSELWTGDAFGSSQNDTLTTLAVRLS